MNAIRLSGLLTILTVACLVVLCGCGSMRQLRVQNVSTRNFTNVSIAGQAYGDLAPGEMSDYNSVKLKFLRYAALKLHVDGKYVTAQTLNFGAKRFTYRMDVKDFDAGYMKVRRIRCGETMNRSGPVRIVPQNRCRTTTGKQGDFRSSLNRASTRHYLKAAFGSLLPWSRDLQARRRPAGLACVTSNVERAS